MAPLLAPGIFNCLNNAEREAHCGPPYPQADPAAGTLLLVFDLFVLRVDDIAVVVAARIGPARGCLLTLLTSGRLPLLLTLLLSIHLFRELVRSLRKRLCGGFDLCLVVGFHRLFGFLQRGFDLAFLIVADLAAGFLQR